MGGGGENVRIKNETLVLTTKNNVCVERTLCGVFFHGWFVEVMVVVVLRLTEGMYIHHMYRTGGAGLALV